MVKNILMNGYKCMASMLDGKPVYSFILIAIILMGVSELSAQSFSDPPPLLYNQLAGQQYVDDDTTINLNREQFEKKSVTKAFFLSLLLPGTGEAYLGKTGYTKVFLSLEAVGWGLFIATDIQASSRKQDAENFAVQHAGVIRDGKDKQYWIDIGKCDNIFEYNEQRRRDRDVDALYPENRYFYWRWDFEANRLSYDGQRIRSAEIDERKTYILGAIILNHLVSAINSLRLARAHNRKIDELSWKFDVGMNPRYGQLSLGISKTF